MAKPRRNSPAKGSLKVSPISLVKGRWCKPNREQPRKRPIPKANKTWQSRKWGTKKPQDVKAAQSKPITAKMKSLKKSCQTMSPKAKKAPPQTKNYQKGQFHKKLKVMGRRSKPDTKAKSQSSKPRVNKSEQDTVILFRKVKDSRGWCKVWSWSPISSKGQWDPVG